MASMNMLYIELIVGAISFVALVAILIFHGSLIWLQTRVTLLGKKGFAQIRHVREDKVEKYYYLRVRDEHYDFNKGIYIAHKDAYTKTHSVLNRFDYGLLKDKRDGKVKDTQGHIIDLSPEEAEILKFLDGIKNNKVMDISTLSWGIPTITYFGNDPNPHNFSDRKKMYDAKNIAAMIKRIIMTKEWKLVRIVLILCAISIVLWVGYAVLTYGAYGVSNKNMASCTALLNESQQRWMDLANRTAEQVYQVRLSQNQSNVVRIG